MQLVKHPNPVLKQKADDWNFSIHTDAVAVENEMLSLMRINRGIGLAGNQVGLLCRVFVMRTQDGREFGAFNPEIIKGEETVLGEEGCLSFPELFLPISRYQRIIARYLDSTGEERIIELEGIDARCFQHELDHLDGVCFTDTLSPLKLALALKKSQKKRKK
jgi:peptide deformylase